MPVIDNNLPKRRKARRVARLLKVCEIGNPKVPSFSEVQEGILESVRSRRSRKISRRISKKARKRKLLKRWSFHKSKLI